LPYCREHYRNDDELFQDDFTMDSEDDDGDVLIRREDNYNRKDLSQESITTEDENNPLNTEDQAFINNCSESTNNVSAYKKKRKSQQSTVKTNENNSQDDSGLFDFKSPKKFTAKSHKKNKTTPNVHVLSSKASGMAQKTPDITNPSSTDYTTPQMDELLQKITMEEANKAPHKKKMDRDINTQEKLQAVSAGRRVTRSLMTKTSQVQGEEDKLCEFQGSEEAHETVLSKKTEKTKDLRLPSIDPSGDAGQTNDRDAESSAVCMETEDAEGDKVKKGRKRAYENTSKCSPIPKKAKSVAADSSPEKIARRLQTFSPRSASSQSSVTSSIGHLLTPEQHVSPASSINSLASIDHKAPVRSFKYIQYLSLVCKKCSNYC